MLVLKTSVPILTKVLFMVLECPYCKRKVSKLWNFCPLCGTEIRKKVTMGDLLKRQMDILRNILSKENGYQQRPPVRVHGITISINNSDLEDSRIDVIQGPITIEEEPYKNRAKPSRKLPDRVYEPSVDIKRLATEMLVTVKIPDVKSENDIEISRLADSIELRAFADDKGYFKILGIPKSYKLVERSFSGGNLNLKFVI